MKKIIKIPIVIALVAVFACSLGFSTFALTSSYDGAWYDYEMPFFCENISMDWRLFCYNAQGGVSSTSLTGPDGAYGGQSWHTVQNSAYSNFDLNEDYDGEMVFMSNTTTFVMPSDYANFPRMTVELPIGTILGNASVQCIGSYVQSDNVFHDFDYTYLTSVYHDEWDMFYDYVDTSSSFLTLGIPSGSYVSIKYIITLDASYAFGAPGSCYTWWSSSDVFVDEYFPSITLETVDVLSWLPTTIDAFLNVEVFPGVDFGTLLLMVIAVPALFAVLKMLGGGG